MRSVIGEDNVNLSLDLVSGGSVSQCLQNYLKVSGISAHLVRLQCDFNHPHTPPNVVNLYEYVYQSDFNIIHEKIFT